MAMFEVGDRVRIVRYDAEADAGYTTEARWARKSLPQLVGMVSAVTRRTTGHGVCYQLANTGEIWVEAGELEAEGPPIKVLSVAEGLVQALEEQVKARAITPKFAGKLLAATIDVLKTHGSGPIGADLVVLEAGVARMAERDRPDLDGPDAPIGHT
jgi:hypothetical protein